MLTRNQWLAVAGVATIALVLIIASLSWSPNPGPGPNPPAPPTPDVVVPIKEAGFRVLVVYESADGTPSQVNGAEVRGYLNSHCVKGPDGKTPDYRVWDQDVDLTNASRYFVEAMLRPRASLPWVMISDGKRGYEGPLPATSAEVLELLKKYGGA